ncbi:hypothetical protein CXG81DRAFT_25382 [Caulochytrium protostelioides]|uniref:G-protein coupled receptors family 3 profile domain-containing protein n=2 Tax=Caulochytrium protostelioides TaxID=1555241 RepID=A0A4P9X9I9_9FUNG|nr:hypothetical protein CXG81DRAFT_25382 [Caulochytrium protostelioides]|eukprot:RKP01965.1 hypothetical protein CXG81DRAFT_25382 [Caulochytrium protostelioides]
MTGMPLGSQSRLNESEFASNGTMADDSVTEDLGWDHTDFAGRNTDGDEDALSNEQSTPVLAQTLMAETEGTTTGAPLATTDASGQKTKVAQLVNTAAEKSFMIACAIFFGLQALALILGWSKYNYAPLRAKQLPLLTISFIASVFWMLGTLQSNHVLVARGVYQRCILFGVWFALMGIHVMLLCFAFRMIRLYRAYVAPKLTSLFYLRLFAFTLMLPIVAAVGTVVGSKSIAFQPAADGSSQCVAQTGWKAGTDVVIVIELLFLATLSWSLRRMQHAYQKRRETIIGSAVVSVTLILNMFMGLSDSSSARLAVCALVLIASNVYFWLLLGMPLFNCFFRPNAHLDKPQPRAPFEHHERPFSGQSRKGSV